MYFDRSALICGWSACIAFIEVMLLMVSGKKRTFVMTVSRMMATP